MENGNEAQAHRILDNRLIQTQREYIKTLEAQIIQLKQTIAIQTGNLKLQQEIIDRQEAIIMIQREAT